MATSEKNDVVSVYGIPSGENGSSKCLSVYHEGEVGRMTHYADAFYVGNGRYGGWYGYGGEGRVVWKDFRYGRFDPQTFISLARGEGVSIPGSYGKKKAMFSQIEVTSKRPLSACYQKERRRNADLEQMLCSSFTFVAHHFVNADSGEWSPDYHGVIVVRGDDYPHMDWAKAERAFYKGEDLPDCVVCWGSDITVDDFLHNLRMGIWEGKARSRDKMEARRWRVDIRKPADWKRWFCERHDRFDIYGSDWVDPADVVWATQELVCPYDSENACGICVGIRVEEGQPVLTFVADFVNRSEVGLAKAFFGHREGLVDVLPVIGDAEIYGLKGQFEESGIQPVYSGSLDCERFYA